MFHIDTLIHMMYDEEGSDVFSEYRWDSDFNSGSLIRQMIRDNQHLFDDLKGAISEMLQIPYQDTGCKLPFSLWVVAGQSIYHDLHSVYCITFLPYYQ